MTDYQNNRFYLFKLYVPNCSMLPNNSLMQWTVDGGWPYIGILDMPSLTMRILTLK